MNSKIISKKQPNKPSKKHSLPTLLLNSLVLVALMSFPTKDLLAANNLSTLQKQIKESKNSKSAQSKQQQALEDEIAKSEQETAVASLKLQQTEEALILETKRFGDLQNEIEQLSVDRIKQQKLLEQQLISAYMAGQNDLIKLLLNQEDLSKIIRAKSYYDYLNKARLESIEELYATQQRIEENKTEQENSLLSLKTMRDTLADSKNQLVEQKDKRTKALRELQQDINYQSARLAQLGDAEKKLKQQLRKQKEARAEKELAAAKSKATKKIQPKSETKTHSKIASLKGKLEWPIKAKVLARFGSKRSDQVKWKGISIAANEGEKVRAVATGRVLFAGYFKGYGMVIALDHSDDYITLYGYNQTLLQKTGDTVFQGDAIALAGHSGGQDKNSLYFELSHKGKAEDPIKWLAPHRY